MSAATLAAAPFTPREPGLTIGVEYTGALKSRCRTMTAYDPRLDQMLQSVLDDMALHATKAAVKQIVAEKEPLRLCDALAVVAFDDQGKATPVALLTAFKGRLDFQALKAAMTAIGGRP